MSRRGLWCRQVCAGYGSWVSPLGGRKCFDNSSQNFEHGPFFLSGRCYAVFQRSRDRFPKLISPIYPSVCHLFNDASANSTGKSTPWEAYRFPQLFKEFTVLWNPNFLYVVHKEPPPVHFLCQMNPVHTLASSFTFEFNYFFILSTPSPAWCTLRVMLCCWARCCKR